MVFNLYCTGIAQFNQTNINNLTVSVKFVIESEMGCLDCYNSKDLWFVKMIILNHLSQLVVKQWHNEPEIPPIAIANLQGLLGSLTTLKNTDYL